ncbi:MFS transporter [Chloroflexota bacterium]
MFFGWWIVAASFFIALYTGGAIFYGFTAIFEPIVSEFDWSYTQISLAASLRGLEMGLLAPLTGIFVDRWGPRKLVLSGIIITVLGLIVLSSATSLAMFYGAFILITIGMSCSSMTVLMTTVANWFRRRVGTATGLVVSGFGAGGLLIPVMVRFIELYGWRSTMTIFALGMLVLVLPLSFLFRHKPEQYGYLPDGQAADPVISDINPEETMAIESNITTRQALKSGTFWLIALAFVYLLMVVAAIATHVMPYLSSIGIDRSTAGVVATAIPLTSIGGRLGLGWLGDKFNRRLILAAAFAMMGVGLLCFGYIPAAGIWLMIPFVLVFSVGYGGCVALRPSLTRDYFGRANFGTIFGLIVGVSTLGAIIGPPLAGWVYDSWNSYQGLWFIFASLSILPIVSVMAISSLRKSSTG